MGKVGHWLSIPVLPGVNPFLLKRSSHMGTTVAGILDAPPRQAGPFSYRSVVSVPTASANAAAWNENTTRAHWTPFSFDFIQQHLRTPPTGPHSHLTHRLVAHPLFHPNCQPSPHRFPHRSIQDQARTCVEQRCSTQESARAYSCCVALYRVTSHERSRRQVLCGAISRHTTHIR